MSENESRLERGPSLLETYLGAIELAAEKMARETIKGKGRRKVTVEAELENNPELKAIRITTLLIRKDIGLISENAFTTALEKIRKTQPSSEISRGPEPALTTPKS